MNINNFYSFENYENLIKLNPLKEQKDFQALMKYSKVLNQKLRDDFEFEENLRPLIVSGIFLALEDESFCSSYVKKQNPIEIAHLLITTIKERLEHDNIGETKKNTVVQTYNFLKINTNIITPKDKDGTQNTHLKNLIKEIEINVRPFLHNYKQYDIIGRFYNEFLRYANGDGGLGIVLTPKHITELFVELAEINENSVVIDNCCGTAGFLISAMRKMEELANKNEQKIKRIHKKQLIGIENNPKMFCLACSNMMLRGDGKSNVYQKDCFLINKEDIKRFKPTTGFLNPPYSKENGHKELSFVENCLDFLESHGICIAIVPQSCAMNTKKGNLEIKRRLLKKHTLKTVLSMPDNLFEDNEQSAVTRILIFEANKPYNDNYKTWFGYCKNDGFMKIRPFGRIDYYKKFENTIKKFWLNNYFERKEIEGFSVLKNVSAEDEWLVEPYIKTDFKNMIDEDFEKTLKEYSAFLYYNDLSNVVSKESFSGKRIKTDFSTWKEIKINDIFNVKGSKTTDKKILDEEVTKGKKYPYVTTQATNNGVGVGMMFILMTETF